jgi:hypothetical protein
VAPAPTLRRANQQTCQLALVDNHENIVNNEILKIDMSSQKLDIGKEGQARDSQNQRHLCGGNEYAYCYLVSMSVHSRKERTSSLPSWRDSTNREELAPLNFERTT